MSYLDYSQWMLAEWTKAEARSAWERYVEGL